MNRFLLSGLLALLPLTSVVAQNPTEILTKAEKSAIGTSSYSELSMSAKRARYTRELDIKSWTHTNKYALIVVCLPPWVLNWSLTGIWTPSIRLNSRASMR